MAAALENLPSQSDARDDELVDRVRSGDTALFAVLIRRYNQRLFRIARSITGDDSEAEDVTQQAFLSAFQHLKQFAGRAEFSSWLTRIAVNEAFSRTKKQRRYVELADDEPKEKAGDSALSPEDDAIRSETRVMLEAAVDQLAEHHRTVFVLRDVLELSTGQTATALAISDEAVRTRLHRARAALRDMLLDRFGIAASDVFPFGGVRCDRIVSRVFAELPGATLVSTPVPR